MTDIPQRDSLLYVYAIVPADDDARHLLESRSIEGINGSAVFVVRAGKLAAAVSDVPAAVFDEAPLNELLRDLTQLAPYAVQHEAAIAALLPSVPALIPMTFGTVYRTPETVMRTLEDRADELRELLEYLTGKQEWGLRVVQQVETVRASAEQADETRRLDQAIADATPGHAYLLQKRREATVQDEIVKQATAVIDAIMVELRDVSVEWREYPIVRDPADPTPLVLRAALLIANDHVSTFRAAARALDANSRAQGYRVTIDGPWASYSFVGRRREPA